MKIKFLQISGSIHQKLEGIMKRTPKKDQHQSQFQEGKCINQTDNKNKKIQDVRNLIQFHIYGPTARIKFSSK